MRTARRLRRPTWRAGALAGGVVAALLTAVTCGLASTGTAALYAYPANPLYAPAAALESGGDHAVAAELTMIARTPSGLWAAGQAGDIATVRSIAAAGQAHAIVIVEPGGLADIVRGCLSRPPAPSATSCSGTR